MNQCDTMLTQKATFIVSQRVGASVLYTLIDDRRRDASRAKTSLLSRCPISTFPQPRTRRLKRLKLQLLKSAPRQHLEFQPISPIYSLRHRSIPLRRVSVPNLSQPCAVHRVCSGSFQASVPLQLPQWHDFETLLVIHIQVCRSLGRRSHLAWTTSLELSSQRYLLQCSVPLWVCSLTKEQAYHCL